MTAVELTTHAKSSVLYGRSYGHKSKFFRLDGLLLFCIIMGLRSASSAFIKDATSFFLDVLCVSRCGVSDG